MAQSDNAPNKPVHLMFFVGAIIMFYLLQWTVDWIWGYFTRVPSELYLTLFAGVATATVAIIAFRNETVYSLANEVAVELKKVSWPTSKEVKAATIVVLIMVAISAAILGLFDTVWSKLTELFYG